MGILSKFYLNVVKGLGLLLFVLGEPERMYIYRLAQTFTWPRFSFPLPPSSSLSLVSTTSHSFLLYHSFNTTMRFILPSLLLVAAGLVATNPISIDSPPDAKLQPVDSRSVDSAKPIVGRMTNARRFALGLPPLKPKALRRGTRAASARRASTSTLPPITHHCNILVKNANDPSVIYGFITPSFNYNGGYGSFQATQEGALEVTFDASPDNPVSAQLDLHADNGPSPTYPYVGAVIEPAADSDYLGPGSPYSASIAGTKPTAQGATPVGGDSSHSAATGDTLDYESAIWEYNAVTQEITAQWINPDGSAPTTYIVYATGGNTLLITGDPSALNNAFAMHYPTVTFTCVPALTGILPP